MEALSWEMLLFLIVTGFLAAFVDSVVGGGGLITVPALLFTGLPPALVLGTNKLAGTMCSLTSMTSFLLSGKIHFRLAAALFPLSLVGSMLGALLVHRIPSEFLKPLVVVLLIAVTVYTLLKKIGERRPPSAALRPGAGSGWRPELSLSAFTTASSAPERARSLFSCFCCSVLISWEHPPIRKCLTSPAISVRWSPSSWWIP